MKVYRRHNCQRQHRTPRTFAQCAFRRAAWVAGNGPYACLAWCDVLTVELHATEASADAAKARIDDTACGHACTRRHEVVRLEP